MNAAKSVMPSTGALPILEALGLSAATFYRQRAAAAVVKPKRPRPTPARALSKDERKAVLDTLHSERFVDKAPAEVVATLLDENKYLASERTMYRILEDNAEVRERRNQLRHPEYKKPELIAEAPNQVWSWDITKLRTHQKLVYLYLYVLLDIFSRYVTGWMVAEHEKAKLAERLIRESCARHDVNPKQLTLHSDRGSPMRSGTVAQLLACLDVTPSFSRPHVSDDNPYSESQFKTLKYHPGFPNTFNGLIDAKTFCNGFFHWYNHEHHHSGIVYLTPYQVHSGQTEEALSRRHKAQLTAWEAHPERFIRGQPRRAVLPGAVYINKPQDSSLIDQSITNIDTNFQNRVSQNA